MWERGWGLQIALCNFQGESRLEIRTVCNKYVVFRIDGITTYVFRGFGVVDIEGEGELQNSGKGNASSAVSIYISFNIGIRHIIHSDKHVNLHMK